MVICTLGVVVSKFQMFKEIPPVGQIALRWLWRSLQNEVRLGYSQKLPRGISNSLFLHTLWLVSPAIRVIQLKTWNTPFLFLSCRPRGRKELLVTLLCCPSSHQGECSQHRAFSTASCLCGLAANGELPGVVLALGREREPLVQLSAGSKPSLVRALNVLYFKKMFLRWLSTLLSS